MEGFGNFIKNLSIVLIVVFIIIFTSIYFKDKHSEESHINEIDKYENKINCLEDSIYKYKNLLDSLIINYDKDIDSLNNIKRKKIIIYEKQIIDFSNDVIVDDDSIISFIATKIQD